VTDLDPLVALLGLKEVARAGWIRAGVPAPESVAAHSHGVAVLALALARPDLDLAAILTFAALHDLPEIRTGDITPHDGVDPAVKRALEDAAMATLTAELPARARLHAAFVRYEAQACPESRFVRQLDRLDMALQAVAYARAGRRGLAPFVLSALGALQDPDLVAIGRACLAAVHAAEAEAIGP
jgi:putative hydrolases of HD superfamily